MLSYPSLSPPLSLSSLSAPIPPTEKETKKGRGEGEREKKGMFPPFLINFPT